MIGAKYGTEDADFTFLRESGLVGERSVRDEAEG